MELAKRWWTAHGTKILGYGGVVIGMLEYVDQQTIKMVETIFGPKYGPAVSHVLTVVGGILVARRGYINSAKNNAAN